MQEIDRDAPIAVTGATGYVAGWIVKKLLEAGHTVHAAVRDPKNMEKLQYLEAAAEGTPGSIRYFESDLLREGSYDEAVEGCQLVFHTASPFQLDVEDPQRDLVDPALKGTRNVLGSVERTPSVRRVVLTSSVAAIHADAKDCQAAPGGVLTEEQWNESASLDHQPYSYSKTVAEKEAWKIAEGQNRWDLVVINPSLVIGPGINPRATSESFSLFRQLGDGTMKIGVPNMGIGVVDVRDVADAHIAAAFKPDASGRHIVSAQDSSFPEIAACLREKFPAYPIPKRTLPKWLVWLVGPLVNKAMTRKMVSRSVNWPFRSDNSKSIRELGLRYRPLDDSAPEFFQQLIDAGTLPEIGPAKQLGAAPGES